MISISILGIGNIGSLTNVSSEANVINFSPKISGIYGGALLTIIGNGFPRKASQVHVVVGSNPCNIVQMTAFTIECIIPPQTDSDELAIIDIIVEETSVSSTFFLNYSSAITPNITSISEATMNTSTMLRISGSNFVVDNTTVTIGSSLCRIYNMSTTLILCLVSSEQPAGRHAVIVHVNFVGQSNSDQVYTSRLQINSVSPQSGSYGGGLPVTIAGSGFNGTNVIVSVCNKTCLSVVKLSNVALVCVTPSFSMTEVNDSCNLTVTVDDITETILFTYERNLTATLTAISPQRGGTGGGTTVTITGLGFP